MHLVDHVAVLAREELELRVDDRRERVSAEDQRSSRYSSRCARADASQVSSRRARSAPARAAASASGSPSSSPAAAVSASTSPSGTTLPAPKAADRLAEPGDVVDDGGHAGAERLQERARLVELGAVGEESDRRLGKRAVDLGLGEVPESPLRRAPPRAGRRAASRGRRRRAGARRAGGVSSRSHPAGPCTGGSRRARAGWRRHRRAPRCSGRRGGE